MLKGNHYFKNDEVFVQTKSIRQILLVFLKEKLILLSKEKGGIHVLLITGIFNHYIEQLPETCIQEVKHKY